MVILSYDLLNMKFFLLFYFIQFHQLFIFNGTIFIFKLIIFNFQGSFLILVKSVSENIVSFVHFSNYLKEVRLKK